MTCRVAAQPQCNAQRDTTLPLPSLPLLFLLPPHLVVEPLYLVRLHQHMLCKRLLQRGNLHDALLRVGRLPEKVRQLLLVGQTRREGNEME